MGDYSHVPFYRQKGTLAPVLAVEGRAVDRPAGGRVGDHLDRLEHGHVVQGSTSMPANVLQENPEHTPARATTLGVCWWPMWASSSATLGAAVSVGVVIDMIVMSVVLIADAVRSSDQTP